MRKIYLFPLILLILEVSIHSEGSDIEFRLIEYFRNGNLSGIEKIIKCGKVQKEFVLLYEGQVAVVKRDYERADKYFSEVMKFIKDKENRVYIVAEYLRNMMRLNEGFTWYKKKLINNMLSNLENAKRKKEVSYKNRVEAYHLSEELIYIEPTNPVNKLLYARTSLAVCYEKMTINQIGEIFSRYPLENMETLCESLIALADSYYYATQRGHNIYHRMPIYAEDPYGHVPNVFDFCDLHTYNYALKIVGSMLYNPIIPKKYKEIAAKRLKIYSRSLFNSEKSKAIFLEEAIRYAKSVNNNMNKE